MSPSSVVVLGKTLDAQGDQEVEGSAALWLSQLGAFPLLDEHFDDFCLRPVHPCVEPLLVGIWDLIL